MTYTATEWDLVPDIEQTERQQDCRSVFCRNWDGACQATKCPYEEVDDD